MGYKVFYSFQTDINSKLNLGFIKNAIKKAIRNIKEFDIEPLIDGFGEVGGNREKILRSNSKIYKKELYIITIKSSLKRISPINI